MKQFIENIYATRSVVGQAGQIHKLHSEIDRKEGAFLFSIIQDDPTIYNTLEVGCAYGLYLRYTFAQRQKIEQALRIPS